MRSSGNWHFGIQGIHGGRALRCISSAEEDAELSYCCRDPFHPLPAARRTDWEAELTVADASDGIFGTLCRGGASPLTLERRGEEILIRDTSETIRARVGEKISLRISAAGADVGLLTLHIPAGAHADLYLNQLWGRESY